MWSSRAWLAAAALALASCGFQLRGVVQMEIGSLYMSADVPSQVATEIRRSLAGSATRLAATPADAEAHLRILGESRDKTIFTLTGAGRVNEYQLRLQVRYQLTAPGTEEPLIEPATIDVRRVVTYSESAPLAKELEEQLLFRDMQADAAGQILRRVATVHKVRAR